jgi:N-acetylneuraminic acid mutarotase
MLVGMSRPWGALCATLSLACSANDPPASTPQADAGAPFTWTAASACPLPRFEALGVVVDGELWVMGGFLSTKLDVTKRIDIYDPKSDAWRVGPDLPGAETHAGVVNVQGGFMLVGGFLGNVLDRVTTAGVWRWNTASATWSAGPDLPSARAAVAAALTGTELHAAGGLAADGNSDSAEHVVLDLAGSGGWTSAAALPIPRNHGGGAASGGLFFAVAGRHGWDEVEGDSAALDAFDPVTGGWQERAALPLARSEIGASTLAMDDGRILVVGGSIPGKHPSDDVLVYDPKHDTWSALPPLPEPRKGAVAARLGTKVVVTTGSPTSTDPSATTFVGCCL